MEMILLGGVLFLVLGVVFVCLSQRARRLCRMKRFDRLQAAGTGCFVLAVIAFSVAVLLAVKDFLGNN